MPSAASWKDRLTRKGMGRAFLYPDFVLFSFAAWFANIGQWLSRVGIQWLTWELTHSYAWLGAIAFVDAIAIVVFLPIFGTLIDRGDRLYLAKLSQALSTVLPVLLAFLTLTDWINIWILLATMILHGLTEAFWTPVRMALPPSMVPRGDLPPALGLSAILFNLAQILGPAAAGPIIAAFTDYRVGVGVLFAANTVMSLIYLWSLYVISLDYEHSGSHASAGFLADFKEGVLYALHKEGLALFMMLMLATTTIMRAFRELLAGYAGGVFHEGAQGLALLTSAVGVGALLGSILVANLGSVKGLTHKIFFALAVGIVLQFGFALTPSFAIAVACTAGMGTAVAMGGIGSQVLVQSAIHGAMRGRVMSLWAQILRGGPPIGAWIIGLASELGGFRVVMAAATALYLIIFLAVLPRLKYLSHHLEAPPEDGDTDAASGERAS